MNTEKRSPNDSMLMANHSQNWAELFTLVSDAARGVLERDAFVARMKAAHRKDFSNSPDLIEFKPDRAAKTDEREYDVYGCGKARREGQEFKGVAVFAGPLG